jgi:hypothetical protein
MFRNIVSFKVLPRPTPQLKVHPLSAVRDSLLNVLATLRVRRPFIHTLRTLHAVVTGTHLPWAILTPLTNVQTGPGAHSASCGVVIWNMTITLILFTCFVWRLNFDSYTKCRFDGLRERFTRYIGLPKVE